MIEALVVGVVAGVVAGMLGVGGGALLVPAFVLFLGLGQVDAEATSLVAIVPTAIVGAYRQHRYGNVDVRVGLLVGSLAAGGALVGVAIANAVPERALELGFAALLLYVAYGLAKRGLRRPEDDERPGDLGVAPDADVGEPR